MRRPSLLLAAFLVLGGCSAAVNPDDLDPLATAKGYCQTWSDLMIAVAACSFTPELAALEYERSLPLCDALGRAAVRYDREAAGECVALLRAVTCDGAGLKQLSDPETEAACRAVLSGTLADGAACLDSAECAEPDARCVDPELACGRTCRSPGVSGDPCGPNYPACATGHYCWTGETRCVTANLQEGQDCTLAPWDCGEGSYCDANLRCREYAAEGEGCVDRQCDPDEDLFCASGTSKCTRPSSLAVGQPCFDAGQCAADAFCDGTRCVLKRSEGASCGAEVECMPPLGCIGNSPAGAPGACGPRRVAGESCTLDSFDCLVGAACVPSAVGGVCVAWPAEYDAACSGRLDGGCLVGRCAADVSNPGVHTCQDYKAPGELCGYDRECGGALLTDAGGRCSPTATPDYSVCESDCR